jgi:arginyl-tRNA--protein-N-Asp/Glu arginylyltransferase
MRSVEPQYINEEFYADAVRPEQMDMLWADAWRHFGTHFFRYNLGFYREDIRHVLPLRIRLSVFTLSKNQRRVLRANEDLNVSVRPIEINDETEDLFHRHKQRFNHGVPDSIYNFLSREPATSPCEANEIRVTSNDTLVAVSYFDIGECATSGIYAMFEPTMAARSLGIFTLLKEIEYSIEQGKEFYYLGYCYEGESFYDYKKRFRGTEVFDWNCNWKAFDQVTGLQILR